VKADNDGDAFGDIERPFLRDFFLVDFSQTIVVYLGGGLSNIFFNVHPYLGKIPMLTHISQMG